MSALGLETSQILYWCGLRISELLALTPDDIDFENNVIKISKGYHRIGDHDVTDVPKTKKSNQNDIIPLERTYEKRKIREPP